MTRLFVAFVLLLTASQGLAMESLSDFGWKNRVVLVFGEPADRKLIQQIDILTDRQDALAERDMVVIRVAGDEAQAIFGAAAGLDAERLRRDADITDGGFQIVLVGKDGGVKLRSGEVVGDVAIFDLIDRMPMRRAEQR